MISIICFNICRNKIDDDECSKIVFDFLKQQKTHQALVKCGDESISEFVEEIIISQPVLVRVIMNRIK